LLNYTGQFGKLTTRPNWAQHSPHCRTYYRDLNILLRRSPCSLGFIVPEKVEAHFIYKEGKYLCRTLEKFLEFASLAQTKFKTKYILKISV
jgi:hypothetical protein